MRDILFNLGLGAWKSAKDLAQSVQVSVARSLDLGRDAKRTIGGAIRERAEVLKLLQRSSERRGAIGQAIGSAGAAAEFGLREGARLARQVGKVGGIVSGIGSAFAGADEPDIIRTTALAGTAAAAIPVIGPAIKAAVDLAILPAMRELEARSKLREQDAAAETRAYIEERFESHEDRLRSDPYYAQNQAELAHRTLLEREARLGESGWSEASAGELE